ncbi:Uncharacterized protein, contains a NRPS condensation (elongation) domain [Clostridium acidisoli DSM 12555]|uniref:Uncharacterized protein, contains a NRPS condensation (Elongation) domain n=1 Tax=Clostridium acidisoli DSM 12555 TaxID=1121291 RepID=A0A1W1XE09_9CLOT|nr:siderophore synthetase [Clostridium acidisoli]SMC22082.1 Uncharacterized protein, contains a NRPS condensation (elongation) domain [Clostridium acidisoli DSM 12555]
MRFDAEIFDQVESLFKVTKFNDHQLHCVINFEGKINKDIMKKSIVLMLEVVPILGSSYVTYKGRPYWEKVDASRYKDVIIFTDNEVEFNSFITSKTNKFTAPQMKACVLTSRKDSLSIIMNHMICDAAGFKEYLYMLSDLYSKLIRNSNYSPDYIINGDRSLKRINKQFTLKDKVKALVLQNKESNKNSSYKFPMSEEKETNPFILTHKIPKDRYLLIKEYYKKHNVTLNDVVLAAYYRVLYNMLDLDSKSELNIPIMVDMRRNLKDKKFDALYNLSSTAITHIDHNINDNFYDTVVKVNKDMNLKKSKAIGLNGVVKLLVTFGIFNYKLSSYLVEKNLKNPLICMTNIGILDSQRLIFEGTEIDQAFMSGSIKYKPHFQLALSSFKDSITFSVNLYGSSKDKENIENFFTLLDKELPQ